MAIGQYPEGAYGMFQDEQFITRGSARISGNINPAIEWLVDESLPVRHFNKFWGEYFRDGEILIGSDVIVSIARQEPDELGYPKPVLTICNGESANATESNGYVRPADMIPVGTSFQHFYKRLGKDRLVNLIKPSIDRGQVLALPYIQDPYYGDQVWVGAAVGGATTSAGAGTTNRLGVDYGLDARLGAGMVLQAGDYVQSDHMGHFIKWVPDTTSAATLETSLRKKIGQVLYVEELPMRGFLQFVQYKASMGMPRMYSDYDYMQPYPVPNGRDPRAFLQPDKWWMPNNYGTSATYNYPEHLIDGPGLPGLTDGRRIAEKFASETHNNVAIDATTGYHIIILQHGPVVRDEEGAVNPSAAHPFPSKLTVTFDPAGTPVQLKEDVDYVVERYYKDTSGPSPVTRARVIIKSNNGVPLAATDDYQIDYYHTEGQQFGVPTQADWQGSVGLVYIATFFNR